ncbi:MAG: hypothetical protein Q9163_002323 [Psora crenata]
MPAALGHGGHGHTHSRKLPIQKIPLEPAPMDGTLYVNGLAKQMNSFNPYDGSQQQEPKVVEAFPTLQAPQNQTSHLGLPKPPSFSTATGGRSKSMERRKSVGLPTHLNLRGNGYGYPRKGPQKFQSMEPNLSRPWITIKEVISAVLLSLPCALASLVFEAGIVPWSSSHSALNAEPLNIDGNLKPVEPALLSPLALVCGLAGLTMAAIGLRGKLSQAVGSVGRNAGSSISGKLKDLGYGELVRRVLGRALAIGLPFFATSQLGGARVANIMLVALVSNITAVEDEHRELSSLKEWKCLLSYRKWTAASILLQAVSDVSGLTSRLPLLRIGLGYFTLAVAVFAFPLPLPSSGPRASPINSDNPIPPRSSWRAPSASDAAAPRMSTVSPLLSTPEDVDLTLGTAVILGILTYIFSLLGGPSAGATSTHKLAWSVLSACTAALALTFTESTSLRSSRGLGSVLGSLGSALLITAFHKDAWSGFVYQSILISVSFLAIYLDTRTTSSTSVHSDHRHQHRHKSRTTEVAGASRFTNYILQRVQPWPLLHTIVVEKDSRRIFYFMCLNFAFMIVQTFYGIVSGSLGLLSDSIHMFFDCLALVVGLSAAVMSKWPPSRRFPYGYAKIETLAGFANGLFLMLISIEIIAEALERLASGRDIKRLRELMIVSILGLAINLIGIMAFGHAHHGHDHGHDHGHGHAHESGHDHTIHSHGGYEHEHGDSHHDHSHGCAHTHQKHNHDHSPPKSALSSPNVHVQHLHNHPSAGQSPSNSVYSPVTATPSKPSHVHGHSDHNHDHHHSENMMGIYLHVLGDALGSAAVVLSTYLISFNGWSGWDPLASTGIAIIIFATAIPLVKNCAQKLLLTVPEDTEYDLREALAGLNGLRGVLGYAVPKFWIQDGEQRKVMGVIHVTADKVSNLEEVKERCVAFLKGAGLDVLVQVERDGVEDGELAVAAGVNVLILVPNRGSYPNSIDTPWVQVRLKANEFTDEEWHRKPITGFADMSIGEEQSNSHVTALAWSPPGLAPHRRSVLAVLTANHMLSFWESELDPKMSNSWKRVMVVNNMLPKSPQVPNGARIGNLRIRNMAWAPVDRRSNCNDRNQHPTSFGPFLLALTYDSSSRVYIFMASSPYIKGGGWGFSQCGHFQLSNALSSVYPPSLLRQELEKHRYIDYIGFQPVIMHGSTISTVISCRLSGAYTHVAMSTSEEYPSQASFEAVEGLQAPPTPHPYKYQPRFTDQIEKFRRRHALSNRTRESTIDVWIHGSASFGSVEAICLTAQVSNQFKYKSSTEETTTILFDDDGAKGAELRFPWQALPTLNCEMAYSRIFDLLQRTELTSVGVNDMSLKILYNSMIVAMLLPEPNRKERLRQFQDIADLLGEELGVPAAFDSERQLLSYMQNSALASTQEWLREIQAFATSRLPEIAETPGIAKVIDTCPIPSCGKAITWKGVDESCQANLKSAPVVAEISSMSSHSQVFANDMEPKKRHLEAMSTEFSSQTNFCRSSTLALTVMGNSTRFEHIPRLSYPSIDRSERLIVDRDTLTLPEAATSVLWRPNANRAASASPRLGHKTVASPIQDRHETPPSPSHMILDQSLPDRSPAQNNDQDNNINNRFSMFSFAPSHTTSSAEDASEADSERHDESDTNDGNNISRFGSVSTSSEYPPGTSQKVKSPPPGNIHNALDAGEVPSDSGIGLPFAVQSSVFGFGKDKHIEDGIMVAGESERGSKLSLPLAKKLPRRSEMDKGTRNGTPEIVVDSPKTPTYVHIKEKTQTPRASKSLHVPFLQVFRKRGDGKKRLTGRSAISEQQNHAPHDHQQVVSFFDHASSEDEDDHGHRGAFLGNAQQASLRKPVVVMNHTPSPQLGLAGTLKRGPSVQSQNISAPSGGATRTLSLRNLEYEEKPESRQSGMIGWSMAESNNGPHPEDINNHEQINERVSGLWNASDDTFTPTPQPPTDGLRSHPVSKKEPPKRKVRFPARPNLEIRPEPRFVREDVISTPYPLGRDTDDRRGDGTRHGAANEANLTLVIYGYSSHVPKVRKLSIPTAVHEVRISNHGEEGQLPIKAIMRKDFDDASLSKLIHFNYIHLRGSFVANLSARTVCGIRLLSYQNACQLATKRANHACFEDRNEESGFAEARLLELYKNPKVGKGRWEWFAWVKQLPENSTVDQHGGLPTEKMALELIEGFSAHRIIFALTFVAICSLVATLLWIFAGVDRFTSGVLFDPNSNGAGSQTHTNSGTPTTTVGVAITASSTSTLDAEDAALASFSSAILAPATEKDITGPAIATMAARDPSSASSAAYSTSAASELSSTGQVGGYTMGGTGSRVGTGVALGVLVLLFGWMAVIGWIVLSWMVG